MANLPTSPMIQEALKDRRPDDIAVVYCDRCGKLTYYNQGSHCTCEFCDASLDHLIEDPDTDAVQTLQDAWDAAIDADVNGPLGP